MVHCTHHVHWLDVLNFAEAKGKDWTYIILGRVGPTGKTYLHNLLSENGHNTIELSEDIYPFVDYTDDKNHYLVYEESKCVVIILNKPLPNDLLMTETKNYLSDNKIKED